MIESDGIKRAKCIDEVVVVVLAGVFDAKVVNY